MTLIWYITSSSKSYTTNHQDLLKIVDHLKTDGYLILLSPCFNYVFEITHYHTFFFSDKSLNILSQNLGLIMIETKEFKFDDGEFTIAKIFKKI